MLSIINELNSSSNDDRTSQDQADQTHESYSNQKKKLSHIRNQSFRSNTKITKSDGRSDISAGRTNANINTTSNPSNTSITTVNQIDYLLHGQKLSDYDDLGEIGRGQFGTVHKVCPKNNPNLLLVWKKLNYEKMSLKERRQLQQEVQLLQTLQHPGVVRFIGKVHDLSSAHIYLLMEFCDGGDLGRYLDHTVRKGFHIPEDLILVWFAQLVDALHYCHTLSSGQVLHRDIKPQNVLMCQDFKTVKLGDFGLAKMLSPNQTLAQTHVGTPYYMSPEVLTRNQYDSKSDVWSLGCLLYEMATGNSPHSQATTLEVLQNLVITNDIKPLPMCYTKELFSLIKWMLTKKPSLRPSTKDLRKTLAFRMGCLLHFADTMAQVEEKKKQADQVIHIVKEKNNQLRTHIKELQKVIGSQRIEILRLQRGVLEQKAPYRQERVSHRRSTIAIDRSASLSSRNENKLLDNNHRGNLH